MVFIRATLEKVHQKFGAHNEVEIADIEGLCDSMTPLSLFSDSWYDPSISRDRSTATEVDASRNKV